MATRSESAVSKHLAWVFIQGMVFTPGIFGVHFVETGRASWPSWALALFLFGLVGCLLARNLVRMWRAPSSEASRWHVAPLFAVALAFGLMASGSVIDGTSSALPAGAAYVLLCFTVLALAVREVARLRTRAGKSAASATLPSAT